MKKFCFLVVFCLVFGSFAFAEGAMDVAGEVLRQSMEAERASPSQSGLPLIENSPLFYRCTVLRVDSVNAFGAADISSQVAWNGMRLTNRNGGHDLELIINYNGGASEQMYFRNRVNLHTTGGSSSNNYTLSHIDNSPVSGLVARIDTQNSWQTVSIYVYRNSYNTNPIIAMSMSM